MPLGCQATRQRGRCGPCLERRGPMRVESRKLLAYYGDLVRVLVAKEFKVRYKSTFLGYAWSILHPLAFAGVFFILFKIIVRLEMKHYALFLIAGLFPWQCFQNSVNASNNFFLGNNTLLKKVRFPRFFLVVAGVLNDLLHFVATIPIVLLFMLIYGKYPSLAWIVGIPALTIALFLFTYGMSLLVATTNLFFRDMERLTFLFTMLWFYMTPVLFPLEMIPERFRWMVYANPMAALIVSWRNLFLEGTFSPVLFATALGWGLVVCLVAQKLYSNLQWRFAELV